VGEMFHCATTPTTRAYPTAYSSWVVDGAAVNAYRLGGTDAGSGDADMRPSPGSQVSS
jgi:hypothetical protein